MKALAFRLRQASVASLKHLTASVLVASLCALLVFFLWYPSPYGELVGGRELFLLVVSVDVVCGPLLTLIVFDRRKPRAELWRDIGIVVLIQAAALSYGLWSVLHARPVFLAFEGNRFRVVSVPDIDMSEISKAPERLRALSWRGPTLIAARLAKDSDPDFPRSVQLSMSGLHPAFRPSRWEAYETQRQRVIEQAKPLARLRTKYAAQQMLIDNVVRESGKTASHLGYVPLIAGKYSDWSVVVSLDDASVIGFVPLDGW